jgi:hypothetical protein
MAPFRPYSLVLGQPLEIEVVQPDGGRTLVVGALDAVPEGRPGGLALRLRARDAQVWAFLSAYDLICRSAYDLTCRSGLAAPPWTVTGAASRPLSATSATPQASVRLGVGRSRSVVGTNVVCELESPGVVLVVR